MAGDARRREEHVAVIGMSGRFPGAPNVERFWENIRDGVESVTTFSEEELREAGVDPAVLQSPSYVRAKAIIEGIDQLDASFFALSAREAEIMDPQHRLFLECAWEAIEGAGYDTERYDGSIGVFAGSESLNSYFLTNLFPNADLRESVGDYPLFLLNNAEFLCTRASYKLNLRGPSMTVQTACSTSLVAVGMAFQSLLAGQCDMALAGGASISLPLRSGYLYREGMILSPDGHCRAFDADACGTVDGSGVGVVLLKRLDRALEDGDTIHAILRGAAINNDGSSKVGYMAPSVGGQAEVIAAAMAAADVEPETVTYVEAHGTATRLGDPIEIAALTQVYGPRARRESPCAIGSVKTNIGHLGAAAGVASLIKTVQALKHKQIPPNLHFRAPNPLIGLENSPFHVATELSVWETGGAPRIAGVSSFGIGGTNAHVIVEEAPQAEAPRSRSGEERSRAHLLVLSARTREALEAATDNLRAHLAARPDLDRADVAYTLQTGRRAFKHRRVAMCPGAPAPGVDGERAALLDPADLATGIAEEQRPIAFLFSGQGTPYVRMGAGLYRTEPVFREEIDRCAEILAPELGLDLRRVLYPASDRADEAAQALSQTAVAQPALFAVELALARLWAAWGVHPDAMLGHSLGEYVAACLAGVFSPEDALSLVAARGRLMQRLPPGAMLAVPVAEPEVTPLLDDDLSLAAVNGASLCVVSGATSAVDALARKLADRGLRCTRLLTSHAFHSRMMEPALAPFAEAVSRVDLSPPSLRYLSSVTGVWITDAEATSPSYWARHLRQTVRFADGLSQLLQMPGAALLEVGPGHTLATLARKHPARTPAHPVLSSLPAQGESRPDTEAVLRALGGLWIAGAPVDWPALHARAPRRRVSLPTYPFERQRYWIDAPRPPAAAHAAPSPAAALAPFAAIADASSAPQAHARPELKSAYVPPGDDLEKTIASIWRDLLGVDQIGVHDDYFELGGDSLVSVRLVSRLAEVTKVKLSTRHVLDARTIAGLARLIRAESAPRAPDRAKPSPLVTIQAGGARRPLFCVHPVGGNVLCYVALAPLLGADQPVYGLQARGLDGAEPPRARIEEMASDYIEAIKAAQPAGPYLLAGFSFGGVVAFEIAQQLARMGDAIALLALIDAGPPVHGFKVSEMDDAMVLAHFAAEMGLWPESQLPDLYTSLRQVRPDEQMDYITKRAPSEAAVDVDVARPLLSVFKMNLLALRSYVPQPFAHRAVLYRCYEPPAILETLGLLFKVIDPLDESLGWNKLSAAPIEVHALPGDHHTLLTEPYVAALGALLKARLASVSPSAAPPADS